MRDLPPGLNASTDAEVPTSEAAVIATVSPATDTTTPVPTVFSVPLPTTIRSIDGSTRSTALQVVTDIHETPQPSVNASLGSETVVEDVATVRCVGVVA